MREFYYGKKCEGMANESICPHTEGDGLTFSDTALRGRSSPARRTPGSPCAPRWRRSSWSARAPS